MRFAERYPCLFHVTDRAALPGIEREGLLSARCLVERHGADAELALQDNRAAWMPVGPGATLRRQGMRDGPLRRRLDPGITCAAWRQFINGFVFLFPSEALARRFLAAEPGRDQVVLGAPTAAVLSAGVALLTCRFNNGYIDRAPADKARLRRFDDYKPTEDWTGDTVKEVAACGFIPAHVHFSTLPAP